MTNAIHKKTQELETLLTEILEAPKDNGVLKLIVCRPKESQREVLQEARLDLSEGLIGDNWKVRGSVTTSDGLAHPEMQLNIMNFRVVQAVAGGPERWPLAGDQLYLDMDISKHNLPPGTRLKLGSAIIEITAIPHLGCKKFTARFGKEAVEFVNSDLGKQNRLRGLNAKVVQSGVVRLGDMAKKLVV
jgi:hypothetical protein